MASAVAHGVRRLAANGRPIEPDYSSAAAAVPRTAGRRGTAIRVTGLHKSFGSNLVLTGIDLDIAAGEFVAVIGKSGCGKSTLLRLLAGLDQPSAGHIGFGDREAARQPLKRIVFQEPRLLPWESVAGNVAIGLGAGAAVSDTARKVEQALDEVQLTEKAPEWPAKLSGGQRQRVALARALVSRPDLLLFDEPLGALDALTRITMQRLVERVWVEQGFTAIFVTHDVTEAVALADRVIVLDQGRIALNLPVSQPRPRQRGAADLAALEGQLLATIFSGE
jgi:sulfonate transport system ATP-binding protein